MRPHGCHVSGPSGQCCMHFSWMFHRAVLPPGMIGAWGGLVWFGSTPPPVGPTPPPDDQAHGQRNRPCATRLGWALPAVAVSRHSGLTAPEPRGGTRGREIPLCLCVWCARRWGAFGSGGEGGGRCVWGAVCRLVLQAPAGRQWAPDAKPAGGVIGLDMPPPVN